MFDLPPLRLAVTEHRLISRRCGCGTVTKAPAPAGVVAPVQYGPRPAGMGVYLLHGQFLSTSRTVQALADLFGVVVAAGTVVGWTHRITKAVAATLEVVRARPRTAPVVHFDETGLRVAGKLHWMHSASTPTDVLLTVHPRRGVQGMDAAGVLPGFTGTAVHDAWAPYDTYEQATHALCNAHAVRELVDVVDTAPGQVAALAGQGAAHELHGPHPQRLGGPAVADLVIDGHGRSPVGPRVAPGRRGRSGRPVSGSRPRWTARTRRPGHRTRDGPAARGCGRRSC